MFTEWQIDDLLDLLRLRYPEWEGFDHAPFVGDEIRPKQALVDEAGETLGKEQVDELVATWQYDELLGRLERLGRSTNLLFNRVPRQGDLAILYHSRLDAAEFSLQMQRLLYGHKPGSAGPPTPQRLQAFSNYCLQKSLPNKWTFPTFFLFLTHPREELFVKPQVARWFLRFLGLGQRYTAYPDGDLYATLRRHARGLLQALHAYGARDMVDVHSFLWVCSRESRGRTGRLDVRGQVELDVPPTTYTPRLQPAFLAEGSDEAFGPEQAAGDGVASQPAEAETDPHFDREGNAPYTLSELAADSGLEEETLARWVQAIHRKGQAILYGPPGTGKTRLAQGLARHLSGGGDGFADLVQFHPTYQYEDFIQGLRPVKEESGALNYEMVPGRFLQFCQEASRRRDICTLIIDEINRASLSRVLGELMYLLEYRDRSIPLAGGGEFTIPANVRLIGTMNTADRSIAVVDHALRRRFAFIGLHPNYELLRSYHQRNETGFPVESLVAVLQRLNDHIGDPHYEVGITFFLRRNLQNEIGDVWQMEIEPYLEEYFFDRPERVDAFRWAQLRGQILAS